jgi:tripartite-type tricarboxylate transporter receptor subunit TctC
LPLLPRIAEGTKLSDATVRLIVCFAAGGGSDIVARLIGQWLSERLVRPFIVENRRGANTNIATETVVRAPPDGYTLLLVDSSAALNATMTSSLLILSATFRRSRALPAGAPLPFSALPPLDA